MTDGVTHGIDLGAYLTGPHPTRRQRPIYRTFSQSGVFPIDRAGEGRTLPAFPEMKVMKGALIRTLNCCCMPNTDHYYIFDNVKKNLGSVRRVDHRN